MWLTVRDALALGLLQSEAKKSRCLANLREAPREDEMVGLLAGLMGGRSYLFDNVGIEVGVFHMGRGHRPGEVRVVGFATAEPFSSDYSAAAVAFDYVVVGFHGTRDILDPRFDL